MEKTVDGSKDIEIQHDDWHFYKMPVVRITCICGEVFDGFRNMSCPKCKAKYYPKMSLNIVRVKRR